MGGDPIWREHTWAPNQKLPPGYVVGSEWGEIGNGRVGIGCYYFTYNYSDVVGVPRRTRWEARRDALAHSKGEPVEVTPSITS